MKIKTADTPTKYVRERSTRPIRNRRFSRRAFGDDRRSVKRLFTPEIKRYLKDWLVRRRDNPYPNREEKKILAVDTGLTYIQICNWFANWRRKLKNAGSEPQRKTWGHLIKSYNTQAQGNVEQFSICSDNSIWEEPDIPSPPRGTVTATMDHCYTTIAPSKRPSSDDVPFHHNSQPQCYQVSSTTNERTIQNNTPSSKYKNHIMEKYWRGLEQPNEPKNEDTAAPLLTKWLESAEKFQPRQRNYVTWESQSTKQKEKKKIAPHKNVQIPPRATFDSSQHQREELDAAEALTKLAGLFRRNC